MQILKEEVLQEILSASKKLFLEHGYNDTSMDKIAKEAKISKSNLYNYFKNKESIFEQLVSSTAEKLIDLISYFENIDFDLEKEDTIFISQFTESLYDLLSANKESLLLIFECSKGTQYETIQEKLIDTFASKFARRIKNIENPELIARVLIKSLISGLISILKQSNHINEIRSNLMLLTKYHTYGMKTLFA